MYKDQEKIIQRYNNSTARELWDVYGRCSTAKRKAFENCKAKMLALRNGRDMRILGASCFFFSCAFRFENDYGEPCLFYMTHKRSEIIPMETEA